MLGGVVEVGNCLHQLILISESPQCPPPWPSNKLMVPNKDIYLEKIYIYCNRPINFLGKIGFSNIESPTKYILH